MSEPAPQIVPFLRWVGGKRRQAQALAQEIDVILRTYNGKYYEPFLGGGAVALALPRIPAGSVLSDYNNDLMVAWRAVVTEPEKVAKKLQLLGSLTELNKETYLEIRKKFNDGALASVSDWAAVFIFLNKTCFNGLWRVNRFGKFNVPYGYLKKPSFPDVTHLNQVAKRVGAKTPEGVPEVVLTSGDAVSVLLSYKPVAGDVIYADPPYDSTFANYTDCGFGWEKQVELATTLKTLFEQGVSIIASNADTARIRKLYEWASVIELEEKRSVAADAEARGPANCLVIRALQ